MLEGRTARSKKAFPAQVHGAANNGIGLQGSKGCCSSAPGYCWVAHQKSGVKKHIKVMSVAISVKGREMLMLTSKSRDKGILGQTTGVWIILYLL